MGQQELTSKLRDSGFNRVERDDRLLDIFPAETAEKGVELWERWTKDVVTIVRLRQPVSLKTVTAYKVRRSILEQWLLANEARRLTDLEQIEAFPNEDGVGQ